MKIKDIEVEFDFLDADDVERFEKEAEKVKKQCEIKEKQEMSYSQMIREECKIVNCFFDNVFGEGISEKLFKGKMNLEEHIKIFEDIVKEKMRQQKGLEDTLKRYQPNREQRRNNQFKGNKR